jgi:hypothetical protein
MSSMIHMRCRSLHHLRSWRLCDNLAVARAVIMMSVVTRVTMIKLVGGRHGFSKRIADVFRNRLPGTVISAIPHPAGQLGH